MNWSHCSGRGYRKGANRVFIRLKSRSNSPKHPRRGTKRGNKKGRAKLGDRIFVYLRDEWARFLGVVDVELNYCTVGSMARCYSQFSTPPAFLEKPTRKVQYNSVCERVLGSLICLPISHLPHFAPFVLFVWPVIKWQCPLLGLSATAFSPDRPAKRPVGAVFRCVASRNRDDAGHSKTATCSAKTAGVDRKTAIRKQPRPKGARVAATPRGARCRSALED